MDYQQQQRYPFVPGATTIGVVCTEGVVLASEKRITYGSLVISKSGKKVFQLADRIGAACAGLVSDMQTLVRLVEAQSKLYRFELQRSISVRSAAKLMSNLLFSRRMYPLITQTIIGGIDDEGSSLYTLDVIGSVIPDKFASVGSGAPIAVGVLEDVYREDMDIKEAHDLVGKAIKSAVSRDIMSGDGADFFIITKDGIQEDYLTF